MISEEHEFTVMPAILQIVPISGFQILSNYEKLVQVFYDTNEQESVLQIVAIIEKMKEVMPVEKVVIHYEDLAEQSFLGSVKGLIELELQKRRYSFAEVTSLDILKGAGHFSHSVLYSPNIIVVDK